MKHTYISKTKKALFILQFIFIGSRLIGQGVGIGSTSITPDASSILELRSTSQGLLIPRMNTVQMNSITSPAASLIIFNTDSSCFCFYNANTTSWQSLCRVAFGPTGPTGATGTAGPTGLTGSTGATGATGSTGTAGANGTNGAVGATGPTGAAGIAGTNGTNGAVGATGPTGTTGTAGLIGLTGLTGATGATGATGTAGTNGTNGAVGATGPTGATGAAGTNGTNGATGATGATGTAGTNGTNGAVGATGPTGATGATGTNGTNGATGATGATGTAGTNGTNGAAGATGPTGPTGATGTAGTNGTNGSNGATGPTGATGATGSGSVSSFSAGTLSPLFTTAVATPTTTPALSFTLSTAAKYTILGNNTAATAAPTYFTPILASALFSNQGTTTTVLHGNAAGNPTWSAISLTTDVTGILPLANGGTNASLTASNGGIFYSTATAGAILAGTATANKVLQSGASGAPTWSTATYPATAGTKGNYMVSDGTNFISTGPNASQTNVASPTGVNRTAALMQGLGATITPGASGKILVVISAQIANSTLNDGGRIQLYYGTGTAPANGAAVTGTAVGGTIEYGDVKTAGNFYPISTNVIITGLTTGTTYWVDLSLIALTGGTASLSNVSISIIEL
ncbi:MAG TPA: collagen-like protein [Bacteroidia bacterium]|nr:collagen-like protein [Bacteroidia bacterium]